MISPPFSHPKQKYELVSGVSFMFTFIIGTVVGVIILVTPKEANQLKEIVNGFKTAGIKKVTCWYRKM